MRLPVEAEPDHGRIPGFPSVDGEPGCVARVLASEPQKLLRVRKRDMPCAETMIEIVIGPANASGWPTRVEVAQSGFPTEMDAMPDLVDAHWRQIVADFRLYLERGVVVPGTAWGASFGALTAQTPVALVLTKLDQNGFAARCGMREGDLLLTLRGIRIHDLAQLWTVLALSAVGEEVAVAWARGEALHTSVAPL